MEKIHHEPKECTLKCVRTFVKHLHPAPAQAYKGKILLDVKDLPPLDIKPAKRTGHDVSEVRIEQQLSLRAQGIVILCV